MEVGTYVWLKKDNHWIESTVHSKSIDGDNFRVTFLDDESNEVEKM